MSILLVEDNDEKASRICAVITSCLGDVDVVTASSLNAAEIELAQGSFSLLVLDVSMDIAPGGRGFLTDNHDMLGGFRFAREMYLNEQELPTVVVTAHESFASKDGAAKISSFMPLGKLIQEFRSLLSDKFLGCVRYPRQGWESELAGLLKEGYRN